MDTGVVIEFDFAAVNGAEVLFAAAKKFLKDLDGIKLDAPSEVRYLAGNAYQDGFAKLFASVKTKKTAPKAARDFTAVFASALTKALPETVSPSFRNFIKALTDKGVKAVIATRAPLDAVSALFGFVPPEKIAFYQEKSAVYGTCSWDSWRRACHEAQLNYKATVAVTGSGFGVKTALHAGMGSVAVVNDHVAYQDFGGADDVIAELSGKTAKNVLKALRIL